MSLKLRQCGHFYIFFDNIKNPVYAFEIENNIIKKFHLMCDQMPEEIILPKFLIKESDYKKIDNSHMLEAISYLKKCKKNKFCEQLINSQLEQYAQGSFIIGSDCFNGIKELKIVAPIDYSIMLDNGCFEKDSEIEFILPKDMTLKQVYKTFDTGFEYRQKDWTLISHKDFYYSNNSYCGIKVTDYKPEHSESCNYKISKEKINFNRNQNNKKDNDENYSQTIWDKNNDLNTKLQIQNSNCKEF